MPSIELLAFLILAVIAVGTAIGMLASHHAVYAALFLILNFSTVAVLYLMLDAPFIALSQVTVYAGAIMVLFLFVIMLLGAEQLPGEFKWKNLLPAIILGVLLLAETFYLLFQKITLGKPLDAASGEALANPSTMANLLFKNYLLPFEVTSILLLVAMVGAIVLTKQEKRNTNA